MSRFEIKDKFYLDGEPIKIISGAFHYFRTVPEYWRDRLLKLKAMGGNTVETYIPWNMHEPKKGEFTFEGMLDIEKFIQTAQDLGLYIILRPSPYICAEWEFGGLPAWLLKEDGMRLRVNYEPFMKHVKDYYDVLMPIITKYQIDNGGRVILMQIENEYGYYANDKSYMERMRDMMRGYGVTVPFITSDGPFHENIRGGMLEGAHPTGNFGSRTKERFDVLKNYTNGGPLMCAEFWVGWFDHWGNGGHMKGNLEESVKDLDDMLDMGNVNIYMFEGGTNFGFMNGSNYYDELTPDVTSYDYDAILTEDGCITEKYRRYKEVISKYVDIPEVPELLESKIERGSYGELKVEDKVSLFSVLDDISTKTSSVYPVSMEKLDQSYGYILYHSTLETEDAVAKIRLWEAGDRANILVDKKPLITLYDLELGKEAEVMSDEEVQKALQLPLEEQMKLSQRGKDIDILMENMGRVNFGPRMEHQRKGIGQCVQINGHMHNNWDIYTLPLDNVDKVDFSKDYIENTPAFHKFSFEAKEQKDTFLDFEGWGKGCAFINGFNLGRYWEIGPQKRLYIPAPLIKEGKNEIIMFETEGKYKDTISLKDEPDIG
ncbi:glycoside hydrolase family 35 protein [Butyrivibrio sp. NC2002]|uniref:glycoside hydrolase family 35 protein n=1 Tax=Butyrivibrio sp. NC2002 TaxID=1410610 RepID=UPI000568E7E1|nr:beta-galactosidase family protein [Butyrivibrio sp. NC2002]